MKESFLLSELSSLIFVPVIPFSVHYLLAGDNFNGGFLYNTGKVSQSKRPLAGVYPLRVPGRVVTLLVSPGERLSFSLP